MSINVEEIQTLEREKKVNNSENIDEKVNKQSKKSIANILYVNFFKRVFDILGGLIGIILMIPITLVIWIMNVVNHENGPIFYTQERIGKNGKTFKFFKYRSMVVGADEKLKKYLEEHPDAKEEYQTNKKLKEDPRITKTGAIIRKNSIDEWPQFINVLLGQMTLVGPRPYLPREKEDMGKYYDIIITMKPGLTGSWQVAGRSNLTFTDRLKLDEEYSKDNGFTTDLKILLKTISQVVKKDGAI